MYNIEELNSKEDSELKSIAESMGIKKINSIDRDDLIYRILDEQAINSSKASVANAVEKKKRGRKTAKKTATTENKEVKSEDVEETVVTASVEATVEVKEEPTEEPKKEEVVALEQKPKKERRKRFVHGAENNEPQETVKVESQVIQEPVVEELVPVEKEEVNAEIAAEAPVATEEPKEQPVVEEAQKEVVEVKKPEFSLGSFFNTVERKTFKPTSQQEREEAERLAAEKAAKSTKRAVKQINDNVERTTLGDLDVFAELKEKMEAQEKGE